MREALELAREAAAEGEVPVGAVIVYQDRVIARGRNRREVGKNALCHAELEQSMGLAVHWEAGACGSVRCM